MMEHRRQGIACFYCENEFQIELGTVVMQWFCLHTTNVFVNNFSVSSVFKFIWGKQLRLITLTLLMTPEKCKENIGFRAVDFYH